MDSPTHYELLCVTPDATADDVRAAYRRLIRMYHPDVAGDAGAAMTLRLNEAQRILLDPDLRSGVERSGSHSASPERTTPPAQRTSQFGRDVPKPRTPFRADAPESFVTPRSGAWNAVALSSIAVILAATSAVFAVTYAVPFDGLSPRVVPPIIIALVWMAGGLSRPPRVTWLLLTTSMLLLPLAASGVWPATTVVNASPPWIWALLMASFLSAILLRISAPRVTRYARRNRASCRSASGRASTA